MRKKAFTLIELIVTMAIILAMALISVPAFSKYGKQRAFQQKVDEINSLISQMNVAALNTAQGISAYEVAPTYSGVTNLSLKGWKTDPRDPANLSLVKDVRLNANQSLSAITTTYSYSYCRVRDRKCFLVSELGVETEIKNYVPFLKLIDDDVKKSATFELMNNPFSVRITYASI